MPNALFEMTQVSRGRFVSRITCSCGYASPTTAEAASPLLSATFLPIVLLSGSFGAVSREPDWLQTLMRWLPAQPIVEGAQRALHGAAFPALTARDAAVLAAWTAIGFVVSQRWFRWW